MSEEEFKSIERHLFKRQYRTGTGDWSTKFYGIFTCWDGERRTFPVGDNLDDARDELGRLRSLDKGRYDFDAEKREKEKAKVKALTLGEYLDKTYLPLMIKTPSYPTKKAQCAHLGRLLGPLPLAEVTKLRILEYKKRRLSESIIRHGEAVEGTQVKGSTVNREVSTLIAALNLAAESKLIEDAPRIRKKEREPEQARTVKLTGEQYQNILNASPRWSQRCIIAANEAELDRSSILKLTWDRIQDGLIIVSRDKTDIPHKVGISPALSEVLDELRAEQKKLPNMAKLVFTRNGKPIPAATLRHAFDKAVGDAKVEDFLLKDFRHVARTRWSLAGLPVEVCEIGMGHSLKGMAKIYSNPTDNQIRMAWHKLFTSCLHGESGVENREVKSELSSGARRGI
jgi:integrase